MPTRDRMIRIRLITDAPSPRVHFRSRRRPSGETRHPRQIDARAHSENRVPLGNEAVPEIAMVPSYAGRLYAAVAT